MQSMFGIIPHRKQFYIKVANVPVTQMIIGVLISEPKKTTHAALINYRQMNLEDNARVQTEIK